MLREKNVLKNDQKVGSGSTPSAGIVGEDFSQMKSECNLEYD